ncbi:MAG: hypothetical protein JWP74_1000 [Marmoricola sp.]|nr:hypothetical protein [Marmoricola sp.]
MSTIDIAPETLSAVRAFLDAVRGELADLDPDELSEIADGLEADLAELVGDQGADALGDPVAYAAELRQAADLAPASARAGRFRRRAVGPLLGGLLDAVRERWDRAIAVVPGDVGGILASLQPVWWVARAWIAVQVGGLAFGAYELHVVPGQSPVGVGAFAVALLVSIQLGRQKLVPAERLRRATGLRVLMIALNVFAIASVPSVAQGLRHAQDDLQNRASARGVQQGYQQGIGSVGVTSHAGMYVDEKWVSNIYPYDARGNPLVGVQLFNQIGQPLNVISQAECTYKSPDTPSDKVRVYYPWTTGATQNHNVFPLASRVQDGTDPQSNAFNSTTPPAIGQFPLTHVPAVSLPGIRTTTQGAKGAYQAGSRPNTPVNAFNQGC